VLLIVPVFFSISAPNEPWAWLATTATLAASLTIAILASGARKQVVRARGASRRVRPRDEHRRRLHAGGTGCEEVPLGYGLLSTLFAMGAITNWVKLHAEINILTVLAAVCIYVLLGLSFAFVFECVSEFGPGPFFTAHEAGTRSDYTYFSFVTLATVGYGDLTAAGGIGRALAVTEGLLGQIYPVTTVAALVGNLGRTRTPLN
jgi:Ion channel